MGKQSSRLIYQGTDIKDLYYTGKQLFKLYKGNELVWEKIFVKCFIYEYKNNTSGFAKAAILYPDERLQCTTSIGEGVPMTQSIIGTGRFVLLTKHNGEEVFLSNNGDVWVKISFIINNSTTQLSTFSTFIIGTGKNVTVYKVNHDLTVQAVKSTTVQVGRFYVSPYNGNIKCSSDAFITLSYRTFTYDGGYSICIIDKNGNFFESEIDTSELDAGSSTPLMFACIVNSIAYVLAYTIKRRYPNITDSYLIVYTSNDYVTWDKRTVLFFENVGLRANTPIICRNKTFYLLINDVVYYTEDFDMFHSREIKNYKLNVVGTDSFYILNDTNILMEYAKINACPYFNGEKITQDTDDFVFYTEGINPYNDYANVRVGHFTVYIDNLMNPDEDKCYIIDQDIYN